MPFIEGLENFFRNYKNVTNNSGKIEGVVV